MADRQLIFISYRRTDTRLAASFLYTKLKDAFGAEQIFKDLDNFEPGDNYPIKLAQCVENCDIVLALIGPKWAEDNSGRRIDNPRDWPRIEIASALKQSKRIIPVLVEGAKIPSIDELPADLQPLADLHAFSVDEDHADRELDTLVQKLTKIVEEVEQERKRVEELEATQKAKAEAERRAKERKAREREDRLKSEQKAEAERRAEERKVREREDRLKAEQKAKAEAERRAEVRKAREREDRLKSEQKAKAEAERRTEERKVREREERLKAEQKAKAEAERRAEVRKAGEREDRLKSEQKAKAEAERRTEVRKVREREERLKSEQKAKAETGTRQPPPKSSGFVPKTSWSMSGNSKPDNSSFIGLLLATTLFVVFIVGISLPYYEYRPRNTEVGAPEILEEN